MLTLVAADVSTLVIALFAYWIIRVAMRRRNGGK